VRLKAVVVTAAVDRCVRAVPPVGAVSGAGVNLRRFADGDGGAVAVRDAVEVAGPVVAEHALRVGVRDAAVGGVVVGVGAGAEQVVAAAGADALVEVHGPGVTAGHHRGRGLVRGAGVNLQVGGGHRVVGVRVRVEAGRNTVRAGTAGHVGVV